MINEILQIILECAEGTFLEVGVFVGAVLLIFGYINYRQSGKFVEKIQDSKRWQPIIGALMGLSPGCGGAIFVMPLFIKNTVSFGTVIATLIATMGDSAFIVISKMPFHYILVSIISFVTAIITGYIVDYFKIGEKLKLNIKRMSKKEQKQIHQKYDHKKQETVCVNIKDSNEYRFTHIGHEEGDEVDIALHHIAKGHQDAGIGYKVTHNLYKVFWCLVSIGLVFGIMLLMQVDINSLFIPNIGMVFGVSGTIFSIIFTILAKKFIRDDTHEESEMKVMSLKETLIHNAIETAFVITWVFVAYLIYEFSIFALGGANHAIGEERLMEFMIKTKFLTVIMASIIGLIPGCGPQVIFVTLFTKGMVPFSALLANAISQDGDALFPLLAMDKKSSLWATVITTIPALIIGVIAYVIEMTLFAGI